MKNIFRIISFLEGVSYLLLMFVGMPYKYLESLGKTDVYVKMFGMPHGILFILYIILAFMIKQEMKWNTKTFITVLVASVIPFGTFYIDRKYLK